VSDAQSETPISPIISDPKGQLHDTIELKYSS
jgi:hypothetical protein